MSYFYLGQNKRGTPFPFEASSVKGSVRKALSLMRDIFRECQRKVELDMNGDPLSEDDKLGKYHGDLQQNGMFLILHQKSLVGFWIHLGAHYLEDGVNGAPDKDAPYAGEILEALTEEVWWKNLDVYPLDGKTWKPIVVLEWPSELAYRSMLSPPGLKMPESEYAVIEEETREEFWLERLDTQDPKLSAPVDGSQSISAPVVPIANQDQKWTHLPIRRSLILIVQGKMTFSRIAHKGSYQMIHPQYLGDETQTMQRPVQEWLPEVVGFSESSQTDREEHFLGQPLQLPSGNVGFPSSGWLTKNLETWPLFPKDIRQSILTPRNVGSRAWAQFKQAATISLTVLMSIVVLSLIVRVATTPRFQDVPPAKPIIPQPALSLCSAEHEKFMEEFRCQIRAYALNLSTDKPFCGDKGSVSGADFFNRSGLVGDFADLQPLYCGIRDRKQDAWVWGKEGKGGYSFGELAAAKACFNVLGHPWQYQSKKMYQTKEGRSLFLPEPDLFLAGNLSINQLANLVADLEIACNTMQERLEMQTSGSIFASLIGTSERGKEGDREYEGYALRELTKEKALLGERADLKMCFETGLNETPYNARHYRELCGSGLRDNTSIVWQKLDKSTDKMAPDITCNRPDSRIAPARDLDSCSLVSRYERARFGSDEAYDEKSKPSNLWKCHVDLATPTRKKSVNVGTKWDLSLPVPTKYNVGSGSVLNQLRLDAGLTALSETPSVSQQLGSCWSVVSKRLARYEPVHPILTDLDPQGWPSEEQQVCGQVCASYFRFKKIGGRIDSEWITRKQDIDFCMMRDEPGDFTSQPKGRLDRLLLPWNYNTKDEWLQPSYEEICAFNLIAQSYFPEGYLIGDIAPPVWAGSTSPTYKIAGGTKGPAGEAASSLSRYGRTRSRSTCGYASAQCIAGLMVEVMGEPDNQPSQWKSRLERSVIDVAQMRMRDIEEQKPWCRLVQPYLGLNGELPEGQLDFPCAKGVDETYNNAIQAIETLAKDYSSEG